MLLLLCVYLERYISCYIEAIAIVEMSGSNLTQNLMFMCIDVIVQSATGSVSCILSFPGVLLT